MNEIFTRRSVRKYADKPVEKEKVEKLLDKYYYKWLSAQTDKLLEEV